jgi:branched-chain amino acid aminotransferase
VTRQLACLNGSIMPADEARIPVTDEGLLRGDGVFEVIRVYRGRPFALADHYQRMTESAANLRLPIEIDDIKAEVTALLEAAGEGYDGLLRVLVTRAGNRIAITEPLPDLPDSLALSTVTYAPPRILDGVKSLSYAGNMLATRLAREEGSDEALLVTPHGRVLELPTGSFFFVIGGKLATPPLSDHILASITRARILANTDAEERPCTLDDLAGIEEAFVASTVREVLPVRSINGRTLPALPGPHTTRALEAVTAAVKAELAATSI